MKVQNEEGEGPFFAADVAMLQVCTMLPVLAMYFSFT
jgi:hypothetical protein